VNGKIAERAYDLHLDTSLPHPLPNSSGLAISTTERGPRTTIRTFRTVFGKDCLGYGERLAFGVNRRLTSNSPDNSALKQQTSHFDEAAERETPNADLNAEFAT
jgi:hypothetical protein